MLKEKFIYPIFLVHLLHLPKNAQGVLKMRKNTQLKEF